MVNLLERNGITQAIKHRILIAKVEAKVEISERQEVGKETGGLTNQPSGSGTIQQEEITTMVDRNGEATVKVRKIAGEDKDFRTMLTEVGTQHSRTLMQTTEET